MKCPQCVKEGKKSCVFAGAGMTTLMWCAPFYDEEGVYHSHDLNTNTTQYSCSEGHSWSEIAPIPRCPGCNWPYAEKPNEEGETKEQSAESETTTGDVIVKDIR